MGKFDESLVVAKNATTMKMWSYDVIRINCHLLCDKANFSLYQKENVSKYIEVKNSMTIFLKDTLNQSKEIVMDVVGQIGKNITACLSFVLTVFISDIIAGSNTDDIFSKDITYVSYAIIMGALIVLCIVLVEFASDYSIGKKIVEYISENIITK